MATRTTMAMCALILLGLLLLLPCASVAEEEAAMEALFSHIREIQQIRKSGGEELEKFNAKGLPDLVASTGVESVAGAGVESADAEKVVVGDAASDLMAHIYAVQRKALETNAEAERLRADASETVNVEGAPVHDEEEEVKEDLEQDGVEDPLAQERIKQLDAMLKTLADNAVDNEGELGAHNMQLSAAGANGDDVINLLHKYAQEMHHKLYPNGAGQESQPEDDHEEEL